MTQGLLGESAPVIAIHASALNARPVSGVQADVVLSTSSRGWSERGAFRPAVFEPTVDDAGPVAVSLALRIGSSGRLWVTGDLDVIGDELLSNGPGNRAFGLAGLRWLVKGEAHTTAVRVSAAVSRLSMTPRQRTGVQWFAVLVWPGFWLCLGTAVVWRRRST